VVRLAEACLVLAAIALGNAMKASGSPRATWALVGPPAACLVGAPIWAGLLGHDLPPVDMLLLAAGGLGYTAFIVRLATTMAGEGEAVRQAASEAEAGRQRWRMVFHNSPMARVCFDASPLYLRLQAAAAGGARLGDALLQAYGDRRSVFEDVTVVEANSQARELFSRYGGSGAFGEDFLPAFAEAVNGMDAEGMVPPFEATMRCADGGARIVRVHYRVTDGGGPPWSLCLGAYEDVTEQREAARAEAAARQAAEEANRAKSDFLAVMSHEIRTPLNGVLGMAQAMDLEPLSAPQRERLTVIRQSGAALLGLLDDLLDISGMEAGRLSLDIQDFDLRTAVEGAFAAFGAKAAAKGLAYTLDVEPAAEGIWRGDSHRLRQILTHLISNGIKFTHRGQVSVRVSRSGAGLRVEVADTGIGIAPERVSRLFEKFVQADASATRAYGGAGLGLSICQQLCRAMGGAITVQSTPGAGSMFNLELPLRQLERPDSEAPGLPSPLFGDLRVLAAEDNAVNRMVLKALLGQLGVELTIVDNGAEAVRAWESAHWDAILMDVQMPVMDGPTATMTIRAREAVMNRPRTPILAVTANTMPHQVASYRAAGMDEVVSKPLNVGDLLTALVAAVDAADAERTPELGAAKAG
jgi:signal transduction histidine kinase/AmiR/NasT family two-component response regulator